MPGTGHLAFCSVLLKSWLLEENLQTLLYYTSITLNNNLETFAFIPTDECDLYPSATKFSLQQNQRQLQKTTAKQSPGA